MVWLCDAMFFSQASQSVQGAKEKSPFKNEMYIKNIRETIGIYI